MSEFEPRERIDKEPVVKLKQHELIQKKNELDLEGMGEYPINFQNHEVEPTPDQDFQAWWDKSIANLPINPTPKSLPSHKTLLFQQPPKKYFINHLELDLSDLTGHDHQAGTPMFSVSPELQALIAKYFADLATTLPRGTDAGTKPDDETTEADQTFPEDE